jgi:sphingosine kinase
MIMIFGAVIFIGIVSVYIFGFVSCLRSRRRNAVLRKVAQFAIEVQSARMLHEWMWMPGSRVLVIVNPFSGRKEGKDIANSIVLPMLDAAQINYSVEITTRAGAWKFCRSLNMQLTIEATGEARDFVACSSFPIDSYRAIICVSGDGTLHEVLNGLWDHCQQWRGNDRSKSDELLQEEAYLQLLQRLSVAIIPAGSTNGVSASLGNFDHFEATRRFIFGRAKPIDLMKFTFTNDNSGIKTVWDPFILSWAILADHDDLQERKLRWLPSFLRIALAPLIVILRAKRHSGCLSFLPTPAYGDLAGHWSDAAKLAPAGMHYPAGWRCIDGTFVMLIVTNLPRASDDIWLSPPLQMDSGNASIIIIRHGSRWQFLKAFLGLADGSYLKLPWVEHYAVTELSLVPRSEGLMFLSGELVTSGPVNMKVFKRACNIIH